MKKKLLVVLLLSNTIYFAGAHPIIFGTYNLIGSDIEIIFFPTSVEQFRIRDIGRPNRGRVSFSGNNRIILTFPVNTNLGMMSGQTFTYYISTNSTFSNNLQTWRLIRMFSNEEIETQNRLFESLYRTLMEAFPEQ